MLKNPSPATAPAHNDTPLLDLAEKAEANKATKFMQENCKAVEFEINWFAMSRSAKKNEVISMLKTTENEADADVVSISLKTINPKNSFIQKMNKAKQALMSYRDSVTIPSMQLPITTVSDLQDEQDVKRLLSKKPGERIILQRDVDEFDNYVTKVLIPNLQHAVEDANANIEAIKEDSKKVLKSRFQEKDFPAKFNVDVRGPWYNDIGVSLNFQESCPAAYARLASASQKHFEQTIQLGAADFAKNLLLVLDTVVNQLGCKTKYSPDKKHPLAKLDGGILRRAITPKDDLSIPLGKTSYEIEYAEDGKKIVEVFGPFTEEEYQELCPYEDSKNNKIYASTLETLINELQRFEKIKDMLGSMGTPFGDMISSARSLLSQADKGLNPENIATQLKSGTFFRETASGKFANMATELETFLETLPVNKPKLRRAVKPKNNLA